ncbi:PKHA3 protein, partial [Polyodon spathula]|nr:PKHA3 protein [Polyodon spathula]
GWQPRWFVLDNGILSYYDSEDDVCKGSKGSIKMSVCEIKVHPADNSRMELIIPGEQHFYVKAVNAAERQRWLVALGSSKACLTDTRTKKEKGLLETVESCPGFCVLDHSRTSHSPKESVSSLLRLSQRRTRTYSDTESHSDSCTEDADRTAQCSNNFVNGDFAPMTIPEETSTAPRKISETPVPMMSS